MAKAEIPKNIFDAVLHHQIAYGRYAERQVHDIISVLNKADKEIVALIATSDEDTFTKMRLAALLVEVKSTVKDAYNGMYDQLSTEVQGFAEHVSESTAGLITNNLPIGFSAVSMTGNQLASIVSRAPISVGEKKKLLLKEIFKSIAAGKEEDIRGAIRLGQVQGETVGQLITRLRGTKANQFKDGVLEIGRREAASIVRSTVINTGNEAAMATYQNNSEVLNGWVYVATFDSKTCNFCYSLSGLEFPLGEGPQPIRHVNCRCFMAPKIKTWKELGIDAPEFRKGMRSTQTGLVPVDVSFNDWLATQDKALQVELLGPTRQEMFAQGGVKLDKFTDASGELLTLKQLKKV